MTSEYLPGVRPVREVLSRDVVSMPFDGSGMQLDVIEFLLDESGVNFEVQDDFDYNRVWIEDGERFLDYVAGIGLDEGYSEDLLPQPLDDTERGAVRHFVASLKKAVPNWRTWINEDGELRILVDN